MENEWKVAKIKPCVIRSDTQWRIEILSKIGYTKGSNNLVTSHKSRQKLPKRSQNVELITDFPARRN